MASIDEIRAGRLAKLEALKAKGINPYPPITSRNISIEEVVKNFKSLESGGEKRCLAGRIMSLREQGKIIFIDIDDGTGRFQVLLKSGEPLPEELFKLFEDCFDIGDFIEVTGTFFVTNKGQQTLLAEDLKMLSKSLRPLPEKWHGLEDIETRFRERELDVISDPEVKKRFVIRSRMISALRRFLDDRGFMEVETPVLQDIPGGANARPFITHHNALDIDMYLRIATEIHLKRLIVAGFNKVYEIGRLFRNEGIDHSHNPEFTTIELYWAYAGKEEFISFMEEMIKYVTKEATGSEKFFTGTWGRVNFRDAIFKETGIHIDELKSEQDVVKAVKEKGLSVDFSNVVGLGEHLDQLFKKTTRSKIKGPVWLFDYPAELKPLAKRSNEDKSKSASVQLVMDGEEIINAYYYELNDPLEQKERFMEQEKMREQGSEDAQRVDDQFLKSLEYGMPPTSGLGVGLDRLAMLLTDTDNIKEVILFPTLKPKN